MNESTRPGFASSYDRLPTVKTPQLCEASLEHSLAALRAHARHDIERTLAERAPHLIIRVRQSAHVSTDIAFVRRAVAAELETFGFRNALEVQALVDRLFRRVAWLDVTGSYRAALRADIERGFAALAPHLLQQLRDAVGSGLDAKACRREIANVLEGIGFSNAHEVHVLTDRLLRRLVGVDAS